MPILISSDYSLPFSIDNADKPMTAQEQILVQILQVVHNPDQSHFLLDYPETFGTYTVWDIHTALTLAVKSGLILRSNSEEHSSLHYELTQKGHDYLTDHPINDT
jgi:hypothetical protein